MNPTTDKYKTILQSKLMTYASLLDFRYKCLCVKTSPEALLPIEVSTPQGDLPLEKVAKIGIMDDEHFLIVPILQDLLIPIAQSFMTHYPQLKQEFIDLDMSENVDPEIREQYEDAKRILKEQTGEDMPTVRMLQLTTPEINDDVKKQLDTSVDTLEQMCKVKFQAELTKSKSDTMRALAKDPRSVDDANRELDKTYNNCWQQVNRYTMEEKQAIDEANYRYHQREQERQKQIDPTASMSEEDKKAAFSYNPNAPIEE